MLANEGLIDKIYKVNSLCVMLYGFICTFQNVALCFFLYESRKKTR